MAWGGSVATMWLWLTTLWLQFSRHTSCCIGQLHHHEYPNITMWISQWVPIALSTGVIFWPFFLASFTPVQSHPYTLSFFPLFLMVLHVVWLHWSSTSDVSSSYFWPYKEVVLLPLMKKKDWFSIKPKPRTSSGTTLKVVTKINSPFGTESGDLPAVSNSNLGPKLTCSHPQTNQSICPVCDTFSYQLCTFFLALG